jgi:hypothetical protein
MFEFCSCWRMLWAVQVLCLSRNGPDLPSCEQSILQLRLCSMWRKPRSNNQITIQVAYRYLMSIDRFICPYSMQRCV